MTETLTKKEMKSIRVSLGLSLSQMANICNALPRSIARWESDDDPSPPNKTVARIYEWLRDGWRPPQFPT